MSSEQTLQKLREERNKVHAKIVADQKVLRNIDSSIDRLERECNHTWGDAVSHTDHIAGYTVPGDPPGFGGVDHRPDYYVPPSTKTHWTRTCKKCGKIERTERAATKAVEVPQW